MTEALLFVMHPALVLGACLGVVGVPADVGQTLRTSKSGLEQPDFTSGRSVRLTVVGSPQTDKDKAYRAALEEAREQIRRAVCALRPGVEWAGPRLSQVERFVVSKNTTSEYLKPPVDAQMYTTRLVLELTPAHQSELLKAIRMLEAGNRQWLFFRPFAAVVVILLGLAGYLRLEEATKGYYTVLLRSGAAAAIVLALLAILLLGSSAVVWKRLP